MECSCSGTNYIHSMCQSCLKKVEAKLIAKIDGLHELIDEYESDLDQIQIHLKNPMCRDCYENDDSCECK